MKYYKSINDIPAEDLLLLEMDPDAARNEWSLRLDLPKLSKKEKVTFIPLWIEGNEIAFLSERILAKYIFNPIFDESRTFAINKWIKRKLGENFFLLSKKEAKRLPEKILSCTYHWWLCNYSDNHAYYVDYDGYIFDGFDHTWYGVRPAYKIKLPERV